MEEYNFSSKINQPEDGEFNPTVSRVSSMSINDEIPDPRLNSLPDYDEQIRNENHIEAEDETLICDKMVDTKDRESNAIQHKGEKYFYYDPPLCEETGVWIPVSIPPMSESDHKEWSRGFSSNGGIFPDGDNGWSQFLGEEKELTMWDIFVEMLFVAKGKVSSLASTDVKKVSWVSTHLVEQAWREMVQTLTETNYGTAQEILGTEPPKWLPDSSASACMLCSVRFHPIMCTRHHCRFCGGIFCNDCSKGRRLLPAKFRVENPQRICDVCCVRLESVQTYLMDQVSRAAQLPTHDLTDLSTLRSWLNFPWGQSLEYEIYKCTNIVRGYNKVGSLRPEKSIPDIILREAKGLAIVTVMKIGMMVTYNIGTGLVIARREDGSWSPPSAISSFGAGWGAQGGGELMDLIIVLRSIEAVKTFSSDVHISVGAGLSAAVGIVGRTAEANLRTGASGYAACYTYSCTKGAFIGCSLEGSVVTTRTQENSRFYGSQSLNASDILLGSLPRPPAAATLYRALSDLYHKH
jgi:lipid-binding SYLF domain-containing protein